MTLLGHRPDLVLRGMGGLVCLTCTCGWSTPESTNTDEAAAEVELALHVLTAGGAQ